MSIGTRPVPQVRRGDVYEIDFGQPRGSEQGGSRPALVVSTDDLNAVSSTVVVAAITKTLPSATRERPQQVAVSSRETGLAYDGMVKLDQVLTVSRERLTSRRCGRLSPELMEKIDRAIFYSMGLDDE